MKARNSKANFLELIPVRVNDVRMADDRLELIDESGAPIQVGNNGEMTTLKVDHVIAATGFRPMLDEVFAPLLSDGESLDRRTGLTKETLPTNPGFGIANSLINDPDVLIVGTGSDADFKNTFKLAQLPGDARNALNRNGVENAVAIGFRTPDTRAATRIKFANKELGASELRIDRSPMLADIDSVIEEPVAEVKLVPAQTLPQVRRDVDANSSTLTALFLDALPDTRLGAGGMLLDPSSPEASQSYDIRIQFDSASGVFRITSGMPLPKGVLMSVEKAVDDPYFQAYGLKALQGRRNNQRGLEVSLAFSRGRILYRDPGGESTKGRTFVEAQ